VERDRRRIAARDVGLTSQAREDTDPTLESRDFQLGSPSYRATGLRIYAADVRISFGDY
jgi:hypothetical protein